MNGLRGDEGATSVEYGLFVALVAAVVIVAIGLLGTQVLELFHSVEGRF